jgi:monoamine oxidase
MATGRHHQVTVIGAGLAGLVAARALVAAGLDVVVLEARERVGGRVWSHRLANGEVVELGGEWISTSQTAVIDLARDLGLGLVDTGMDFTSRDQVGGPEIPVAEHDRLSKLLAERMRALGTAALERMTVEKLLDSLGQAGPALTVLRSRLGGTAGASLDEIAAAEIGEEFGIGDHGSYVRVEGGNDRLAKHLSRDLDVRFQKTVTSVHQSGEGVEVVARNDVYASRAVVVAVPLGVLKRMVFEPEPPEELSAALAVLRMGVAAKVAVATEGEPVMFRRQDHDIPGWYWTGRGEGGGVRQAITGFAGSKSGVATLVAEAATRLARSSPETSLSGEPVVVDWSSDLFAGGCYSVIGPGQRPLLAVLSRPWGRIFLAGEHIDGSGTIEGAILSGESAARRLVAAGFSE